MSSRLSLARSRMDDIIGDIGRDRDVQMVSLCYSYAHLTNTVINVTMSLNWRFKRWKPHSTKKTDVTGCTEIVIQAFSRLHPFSLLTFWSSTSTRFGRLQTHLEPIQLATHRWTTHCKAPLPRNPRVSSLYRNLSISRFPTSRGRKSFRRLHLAWSPRLSAKIPITSASWASLRNTQPPPRSRPSKTLRERDSQWRPIPLSASISCRSTWGLILKRRHWI